MNGSAAATRAEGVGIGGKLAAAAGTSNEETWTTGACGAGIASGLNRLSLQFDARQPQHSCRAEEGSGIIARTVEVRAG